MRNLNQIKKDQSLQLINKDDLRTLKGGNSDTTDTIIQPDVFNI